MIKCHQAIWRIHFWSPTYWWAWSFRFGDRQRYINDGKATHHYIIKEEVKWMSSQNVKRLTTDSIKLLWRDGGREDQLLEAFGQLDIDADKLQQDHDIQQIDKGKSLYNDIFFLKEWKRDKRKWYASEYIEQIRDLIRKYPNNYQAIIKTLQIPKSAYYRLMKTPSNLKTIELDKRRKIRDFARLTELEQAYVKALVKPPTEPITVDHI